MGKIRTKHSQQFKARVALAAIQNDEPIARFANRFSITTAGYHAICEHPIPAVIKKITYNNILSKNHQIASEANQITAKMSF